MIGVTAFEAVFELLPERRPEDELDPELRDLLSCGVVLVRLTRRLVGVDERLGSAAIALVNVKV